MRARNLTRVVHEIAGDQSLFALRFDQHADMARRVPDRRDQADLVGDAVFGLDQIDEPGIVHRLYRVGKHRRHILALVLSGQSNSMRPIR